MLFFIFKLFFFKCFSNFLLSRLTFSFNFCPRLLLSTNYCDIYKSITACTFVAAIQLIVLYCIVDLVCNVNLAPENRPIQFNLRDHNE